MDLAAVRRGVLPPDPLRVFVSRLLPGPSAELQQVAWHLARAEVLHEPGRMRDRYRVLPRLAKDEEVVGGRVRAPCAVVDHRSMAKALRERADVDLKGILPDRVAGGIAPSLALVQPDYVPREVPEVVVSGVPARDVGDVHGCHATRQRQPMELAHDKGEVLEELLVRVAVREVARVRGVVVEPAEG